MWQEPCLHLIPTGTYFYHYPRALSKPQVNSRSPRQSDVPFPEVSSSLFSTPKKEVIIYPDAPKGTGNDLVPSVSHRPIPLAPTLQLPAHCTHPIFMSSWRDHSPSLPPPIFYSSIYPGHSGRRDHSKWTHIYLVQMPGVGLEASFVPKPKPNSVTILESSLYFSQTTYFRVSVPGLLGSIHFPLSFISLTPVFLLQRTF